jgi:hypothetical protein
VENMHNIDYILKMNDVEPKYAETGRMYLVLKFNNFVKNIGKWEHWNRIK